VAVFVAAVTNFMTRQWGQVGPLSSSERTELPAQAQVQKLFREAQDDIAHGDYDAAALKYKRALTIQPDSAEAYSNLGVAYHMAGRLADAIAASRRALQINRNLGPANLILGIDLVKTGQADLAILPLENVLNQDASNRDALMALAAAYFSKHNFERATQAYRRELVSRADDADAWFGQGICYEHIAEETTRQLARAASNSSYSSRLLGDFLISQDREIDAEEAYRQSLRQAEIAKEDTEGIHASLGFVHLRLGEFGLASDEFSKELNLHPGDLDARLGLAAAEVREGGITDSIDRLCALFNQDHGYFEANLGSFVNLLDESAQRQLGANLEGYRAASNCKPVIFSLRQHIQSPEGLTLTDHEFDPLVEARHAKTPSDAPLLARARRAFDAGRYTDCTEHLLGMPEVFGNFGALLAQCAFMSGRYLTAFQAAERFSRDAPADSAPVYWKAKSAGKLAQISFQKGVSLKPDSWQGHILLGDIYRQRQNWDQAISNYQAAARLNPATPASFLGLATVYWRNGQFAQAIPPLLEVFDLDPNNAEAAFVLGDIYTRQHRFEEAIPYLKKTLSLNPQQLAAHADLGKAFAALNEVQAAITELTDALPIDEYGDIHYQLYKLYKKNGQLELAKQALATSERLRIEDAESRQRRLGRAASTPKVPPAPE
jgi:tetratricopeptide (TPR) repeat protein